MKYTIEIKPKAAKDIAWHKRTGNKSVTDKITALLLELAEHPKTGTGKPEQLKHGLAGKWK